MATDLMEHDLDKLNILRQRGRESFAGIDSFFFFNYTATSEIYTSLPTLSLHDALPIWSWRSRGRAAPGSLRSCTSSAASTRSEEHTSELQSRNDISYAVFCLKKKK